MLTRKTWPLEYLSIYTHYAQKQLCIYTHLYTQNNMIGQRIGERTMNLLQLPTGFLFHPCNVLVSTTIILSAWMHSPTLVSTLQLSYYIISPHVHAGNVVNAYQESLRETYVIIRRVLSMARFFPCSEIHGIYTY